MTERFQFFPKLVLSPFFPGFLIIVLVLVATIWRLIADPNSVRAASGIGISSPAYNLVNARTSFTQAAFWVYLDVDSGSNHGAPSGLFGTASNKLHSDPSCVYSPTASNGCSTDSAALDQTRGTVFRVSFDPMAANDYAGLNFQEIGVGYNLNGATQLEFDAISPTGGISVQFNVGPVATQYMAIPTQWVHYTINLSNIGLSGTALSSVNLLFGIATNNVYGSNGGTVLVDNIQFTPTPASQTTALGLPLANQVFGVLHVPNVQPGNIAIPPDQINSNLSTTYESSLAILGLIARGQPADLISAKLIADTLVYALAHDNQGDALPVAGNGGLGLHNGMSNGNIALLNSQGAGAGQPGQDRLAGFSAPGLCPQTGFCLLLDGATGGNNAFAIMGLVAAYNEFHDVSYLNAAITIANWIYGNLLDASGAGYGGYFTGYPDQGITPKALQTGKSVENNADIFSAFTALASVEQALGNTSVASTWTARANIAGDFVMQMFEPNSGHFYAGTVPVGQTAASGITPSGPTKGNDTINTFDFLDSQTFTTLSLAGSPRYFNLIDWRKPVQWLLSNYGRTVSSNGNTFQGFDLIEPSEHQLGDGPSGIAWEFTGQAVAVMQFVDALYNSSQFSASITAYLNQILQAQASAPYADGKGLVGSTLQDGQIIPPYQQCLVTPFQCISERVGLGATLWSIFADQSIDPFTAATSTIAQNRLPIPGTTLPSPSATFSWIPVDGADQYWLDVGTAPGIGDYFGDSTTSSSFAVSSLPCDGRTVYVQLWTHIPAGGWQTPQRATYTAASGCAALSAPAYGSTFAGNSVTFSWNQITGADKYWLDLGNAIGHGDIFGGATTATSQAVNTIPCDGRTLYGQLWTHIAGSWNNPGRYVFHAASTCSGLAIIVGPAPGSVLASPSEVFTWSPVQGADGYWLDVGSSSGIGDYFGGSTSGTSLAVNDLPCDGRPVFVQLWTHFPAGGWQTPQRVTYTAASGCAALSAPAYGSTFGSNSVAFSWSQIAGADQYWLDVGNSIGIGDIFGGATSATSQVVNNIPCDGRPLYAQLWTHMSGAWHPPGRYSYTAWGACGKLMTPVPGATLAGGTVSFAWSTGTGVTAYWLDVGTIIGQGNIYGANEGVAASQVVNGIPTTGQSIDVQLWSLIGGVWCPNRYSYTAFH